MRKIIYKGIYGVFIFVFAFLTITVLTIKDVDAANCTQMQKDLKANGTLLDRYGIKINYNESSDKYEVSMSGSEGVFKLSKIRFYEPEVTNANSLDEDDYGTVAVEDENGNLSYTSSINMVFGGRTLNETEILDLWSNKIIELEYDPANEEYKNALVVLKKGQSFKISRSALYQYAGDTRMGMALTFVPYGGYNDKDLVSACGQNATFKITVGHGVEIYNDIPADISYDSGVTHDRISFGGIDCSDYETKYQDKTSFNYNFCKDMDNAQKAGVTKLAAGKTVKGKTISYSTKYNPTEAFKCNPEGIVGPQDIATLKDYYVNKNYLYGESSETEIVGHYVYHIDGTEKNAQTEDIVCKKTCKEVVTVEYGPPVAQKAGLCFEYKVKVTSRVSCSGELENSDQKKYAVCTPTPMCDHGSRHIINTQGGPNEDFDKCVVSCDGGKYSDKCVSKCYKKVYGQSIKKTSGSEIAYVDKLNNDLYITATQVANKDSSTNKYLSTLKEYISALKQNKDTDKLKEQEKYYTYTCTDKKCKTINWNVYSLDGKNYIRYNYPNNDFDNPVKVTTKGGRTVATDAYYYQRNGWGLSTSTYTLYYKYSGGFGIPVIANCNYNYCKWVSNSSAACKSDEYAHYLNSPEVYNSAVRQYLGLSSKEEANSIEKDKKANNDEYEKAKAQCKAEASCSTTSAEFAISVKYTPSDTEKEVTEYFPYTKTNNKDTKATIQPLDANGTVQCSELKNNKDGKTCESKNKGSILLDYSGCYNCNKSNATNMYMTEWGFPGYYEHIKYGDRYYNPDYACNSTYEYYPNKWCIPSNIKDVNQYWYNYYQNKAHAGDTSYSFNNKEYLNSVQCTDSGKIYDKVVDYNIFANTKNFGYLDWEISMKCFYATNKSYSNETVKPCSTKTKKEEYSIRSVDLSNLFPDASGKKPDPEETAATPGFNWTKFAIQDNSKLDGNGTYTQFALESNPPALIKWIQENGTEKIYSDKNVDYAVTLTKSDINAIRKELDSLKDQYTTWPGDVEVNNVYNYRSKLIRETLSNSIYPNNETLKCNNIDEHSATADYSAKCQTFTGEGK